MLRCAAGGGLAPAVECCEPRCRRSGDALGGGRPWTVEQAHRPGISRKVALLARRVHALPPPDRPRSVSPGQWIAYYRRALRRRVGGGEASDGRRRPPDGLEASGAIADRGIERGAVAEPPRSVTATCTCRISLIAPGGAPVILDWEYAHVSDPWWDSGGVGMQRRSDRRAGRELLLRHYLGREPTPAQAGRLGRLAWLYDYVCLLWSAALLKLAHGGGEGGRDAPSDAVAARAERLAERLRHNR